MIGVFDPSRADILLTFEAPTITRGAKGGDQTTWSIVKQCYAERERQSGGESIQSNQQVSTRPSSYKFRHDGSVQATWRCYEGADSPTNPKPRHYIRDIQQWKREGYTWILTERRDNA